MKKTAKVPAESLCLLGFLSDVDSLVLSGALQVVLAARPH